MRIGALAEVTGTLVEAIRFYEREGLLPPPARGENNCRRCLLAPGPCRAAGLCLAVPQPRHGARRDPCADRATRGPAQDCGGISALLDGYIERVVQGIRELFALKRGPKALRACCTSPKPVAQSAS